VQVFVLLLVLCVYRVRLAAAVYVLTALGILFLMLAAPLVSIALLAKSKFLLGQVAQVFVLLLILCVAWARSAVVASAKHAPETWFLMQTASTAWNVLMVP
jgi:hypothetical protein